MTSTGDEAGMNVFREKRESTIMTRTKKRNWESVVVGDYVS